MEKREDRRRRKTRASVERALVKLMTDRDLERITVTELCAEADINRTTFYAHYQCVSDVLGDLEEQVVGNVFSVCGAYRFAELAMNPYPILNRLCGALSGDREFGEFLVNGRESAGFLERVKDEFIRRVMREFEREHPGEDGTRLYFAMSFLAAGTFEAFRAWWRSDRSVSLDELSKRLAAQISRGFAAVFAV